MLDVPTYYAHMLNAWLTILLYYRISSLRRHGYYLFRCSFCAATIWGRLLFEGGVYFFANPGDIKDSWVWYIHVQVRRWRLLDTVSSARSLSVLLSAMGTTRTPQTILALAWWLLLEIIPTCVHVPCLLVAATIRGWRLFCSRASDCAATIWGRHLFEEIRYAQHGGLCP